MSEQKTCAVQVDLEPDKLQSLMEVIDKYRGTEGALIPVLHETQEIFGYIPEDAQKVIASELGVSMAEIYGVITFYAQFSLNPKGKYQIGVCLGTACYVKGSGDIIDRIKNNLKIDAGECTADGKFSLDATRCIGACGLAPVMTINEEVYGRLVADDVDGILAKYQDA